MNIIEVLKALGDETRSRILHLLQVDKLCVCEIEEILKINQSNTSRHLMKLKNAHLIYSDKQAQWVYYGLNKDMLVEHPFIEALLDDLTKQVKCQKDIARLKQYREKNGGCDHIVKKINHD